MPTWDDVSRIALALPDAVQLTDTNGLKWEVHRKHFAWQRPLRKRDLEELGDAAPNGPILGVMVAELPDKLALIDGDPDAFFTVPHFANYPAVLVLLEKVSLEQLEEVITDSWVCRAPKRLAEGFLKELGL